MKSLLMTLGMLSPQLMEVTSQANDGTNTKKLILMGGLLVAFIVVFVLVSKKMKKKSIRNEVKDYE